MMMKEIVSIFGLCKQGILDGKYNFWVDGWEDGTPRITTGDKNRVPRLKALGNAVVPQVIQYIGDCILEYERSENGK